MMRLIGRNREAGVLAHPSAWAAGQWLRQLLALLFAAVLIAAAATPAPALADEDPFVIFKPIEKKEGDRHAFWKAQLGQVPGPDEAKKEEIIQALADYESAPSAKTALGVLQHFSVFADHKDFRAAAFGKEGDRYKHIDLFLTLDALKYELAIKANQRLNEARRQAGRPQVAYFLRVGSSGERYQKWVEWSLAGKHLADMPRDAEYELSKLFQSDDDISNTAHPADEANDPVVNEELNGRNAAAAFVQASDALGLAINPEALKIEFLSPTKAHAHLLTTHSGYVQKWPTYLAALVRSEPEKYNGLFAEEQLHAWGVEKGVVTEMEVLDPANPNRRGARVKDLRRSTKPFKGSAAAGLQGDGLFPEGVNDIAGWMANNYRQIFIVHHGSLKDVAKYTLRMIAWWDTFGVKLPGDLDALGIELPAALRTESGFEDYRKLLTAIYTPESAQQLEAAVAKFGGRDGALELLKVANEQILRGGHRKHVGILAEHLHAALKRHAEAQSLDPEAPKLPPPTLSDLIGSETDFRKNTLLMVLNTLAGAYGNLPEALVEDLNRDLAQFVREAEEADHEANPSAVHDAEVRKYLMLALDEAQKGARRLKGQTAAFRRIEALRSQLDERINEHLRELGGIDLDRYILQIALGEVKQNRLRLIWDEGSLPRVRWVEEQWTPEDVARDLGWVDSMARDFGWKNETYAKRLKEVIEGDSLAMAGVHALYDLFDPARMQTRHVEYEDTEGNRVKKALHPTRFADAALNLGLVSFKMAIKGGEAFKRGWGVWGDLEDAGKLGKALAALASQPGMTPEEKAKAQAQALASTIALLDYAEYISELATKPGLFDVGTVATFASLAYGDYMTDEGALQLLHSAFKDLSLWVYPQLATAYLLYDVYKWSTSQLAVRGAKSDLVEFLVKNGDWEVPDDRQGLAKLKGITVSQGGEGGKYVENKGEEGPPLTLCLDESGQEDLIKPPVMAWLAKRRPEGWEDGIALMDEGAPRLVRPREALLDLFYSGGYESTDQMIAVTLDAIRDLPPTGGWGADWRGWLYLLAWDTSRNWNREWLRDLGIVVPTPDDSNRQVKGQIKLKGRAVSRLSSATWRGFLDGAGDGVKKNFGYLVSQYWVQRQVLMEGPILCPYVKEAARRVQKEKVETVEAGFLDEVAKLDDRLKALDKKVWPEIARSADPIPGATYDPDKDFPITEDFQKKTAAHRAKLREIEELLGQRSPGDEMAPPEGAAPGAETGAAGVPPASGTAEEWILEPPTESVGPTGVTDGPADTLDPEGLIDLAQQIVGALTELVYRYEDDYAKVLSTLAATRAYVRDQSAGEDGAGLDIHPYHVELMTEGILEEIEGDVEQSSGPLEEQVAMLKGVGKLISWAARYSPGINAIRATEAWEAAYKTEYDQALGDVEGRMAEFLKRLKPLNARFRVQLRPGDEDPQWLGMLGAAGAEELALKHPYWKAMLRLRMQYRKLQNMLAVAGEATRDEIAAAVKQMWVKPGKAIEVPSGEEGSLLPFVDELGDKTQAEYDRRDKLLPKMFEMVVHQDPTADLVVTDRVTSTVENRQIAALEGPKGKEIEELIEHYWWEVAPLPGGEYREPGCIYLTDEEFYLQRRQKTDKLVLPLRKTGKFAMRVTALGKDDVPLAQIADMITLDIDPAWITGKLEYDGEWGIDSVSVFFAPKGVETPRRRFSLYESDLDEQDASFLKPICFMHLIELPPPPPEAPSATAPPAEGEAAPADAAMPTRAADADTGAPGAYPPRPFWAFAGIERGVLLDPRAPPVDVTFKERAHLDPDPDASDKDRAHFKLVEPLRLQAAQTVTVSVEVRDASEALVSAEASVNVRDESLPAPAPLKLRLEPGDTISARASRETDAGTVEARSETVTYDPEEHGDAITLKVDLPFFDTGNLEVSGRLSPAAGIEPPVTIAEGTTWSNIAKETGVGSSGAFAFSNDRPVRLADGLTLEALLFAEDGRFLRLESTPLVHELSPGGALRLSDALLKVAPFRVAVEPIEIAATDWMQTPLPEIGTRVFIGDVQAVRAGDNYRGGASFARRGEEVILRAEHDMPDGQVQIGEAALSIADLGDPLHPVPPAEPIDIRLHMYLPGEVRIAGNTTIDLPEGESPPDKITLTIKPPDSATKIEYEVRPGEAFKLKVLETVRLVRLIEVEAEAKAGDVTYTGRGTATVPVEFGPGKEALADVGTIRLAPELALVEVPDLRGQTIDEARETLARAGALKLAEPQGTPRPPPRPDKARVIYDHEKRGEKVPRGSVVLVQAYGESTLVPVPSVKGQPWKKGEGILAGAGFDVVTSVLDPEVFTGPTGVVLAQIPEDWAEPGGRVVIGYLKGAEPEPDAGQPPTGEEQEGPPPTAVTGGGVEGPWVGRIQLTSLTVDGSATSSEALFTRMLNQLLADLKKKKRERERAEAEERRRRQQEGDQPGLGEALSGLAEIPEAIVEGIGEGIGQALAVLILPYGKGALDLLGEGVDVGFALEEVPEGYRLVVPDMPPDIAETVNGIVPPLTSGDGRTFTSSQAAEGTKITVTLVMNEDFSAASFKLEASGRNTGASEPGQIRSGSLTITGEFAPGQASYPEMEASVLQRVEPLVERAFARVMTAVEPYMETE